MEFTLTGTDPRFLYLKRRLEADGHVLTADSHHIIAPPAARTGLPYYDDALYVLENAALTAEGAVALVMRRSERSLLHMRTLVAGYGRIGSLLADKLRCLGAEVTIAARSPAARLTAELRGHNSVDITEIPDNFDTVLNTVPSPVLRGDFGGALCVDLASAPGGWADETPVLKAPGLAGIYAPKAAADIMAEAIYRVMEVDIIE